MKLHILSAFSPPTRTGILEITADTECIFPFIYFKQNLHEHLVPKLIVVVTCIMFTCVRKASTVIYRTIQALDLNLLNNITVPSFLLHIIPVNP